MRVPAWLALALLAACSSSGNATPPCPASVDDGHPCTLDACDSLTGAVTHVPVDVSDGDPCTLDACDSVTGAVTHRPVDVSDGDLCTLDACDSVTGAVTHVPVDVSDGIACTLDTCDPSTGALAHLPDDALCPAVHRCDALVGCVSTSPCAAISPVAGTRFGSEVVATGLASPVHLAAPRDDLRLFVVEQAGRIRIVEGGQITPNPFLDIAARVVAGGEQGLLSLAFHPEYASNGRFFVFYTAAPTGQLRISEFHAPPSGGAADPASEIVLLAIDHPVYGNHNGGQLAFGPDGLLYGGVGDGGGGGDPNNNGQTTTSLLGKLVRIDPDDPAVPVPGNPFGNAVYHYGLRNPWRFSFDRLTGDLYVGDVGQNLWEEVDYAASPGGGAAPPAGTNWGWRAMEGTHCYDPPSACDTTGKSLPILEYPHPEGVSITGGFVYRGVAMPDLAATGTYFYADFGTGFVRTFRVAGGAAVGQQDVSAAFAGAGNVSSFGEDGCGELYLVSYGGAIRRLVPAP